MDNFVEWFSQCLNPYFIDAHFTLNKKESLYIKVEIKPVIIKKKHYYQLIKYTQKQAFHENLLKNDLLQSLISLVLPNLIQGVIHLEQEDINFTVNKEKKLELYKKKPSKALTIASHNNEKNYILKEGAPIAFLQTIGVFSKEFKVIKGNFDKFRQINRFLEIIKDSITPLVERKKLRILDFGCGSAYLTFALYYYLKEIRGLDVEVIGLDLKEEVIQKCKNYAQECLFDQLHFSVGDINTFSELNKIDMMVSLHACDLATDAAIEKAIHLQAEVILAVPCCQRELLDQIQCELLEPLLEHKILKERFSALVTDAARGQLLKSLGYEVKIIEFIDMEHTPKNILIKAIKKNILQDQSKAYKKYTAFKEHLHILPSLEKRFRLKLKENLS